MKIKRGRVREIIKITPTIDCEIRAPKSPHEYNRHQTDCASTKDMVSRTIPLIEVAMRMVIRNRNEGRTILLFEGLSCRLNCITTIASLSHHRPKAQVMAVTVESIP